MQIYSFIISSEFFLKIEFLLSRTMYWAFGSASFVIFSHAANLPPTMESPNRRVSNSSSMNSLGIWKRLEVVGVSILFSGRVSFPTFLTSWNHSCSAGESVGEAEIETSWEAGASSCWDVEGFSTCKGEVTPTFAASISSSAATWYFRSWYLLRRL